LYLGEIDQERSKSRAVFLPVRKSAGLFSFAIAIANANTDMLVLVAFSMRYFCSFSAKEAQQNIELQSVAKWWGVEI